MIPAAPRCSSPGGPEAGATGAGRPGWAGAHGCPRRRPVCGPFPRLGFAARGRCGPSRETRQGSRVAPWDSRRGRALDCAQGTTSAGHLARRRAGGGRDASWRMRVAAVTCCEADDRVVHSAALRAATPRPRRPTTTRRRPTAVSTGARRRHNGASVSRTLTEALRNSGASPDVSRRREADTDYRDAPPPPPPVVCVRAANVRARAYAHGHVCARARA